MSDIRSHGVVQLSKRVTLAPLDLRTRKSAIPSRPSRDEDESDVTSMQTSFASRALALFLVPLMLCYPLAPVFAEDLAPTETQPEAAAPPPVEQVEEPALAPADTVSPSTDSEPAPASDGSINSPIADQADASSVEETADDETTSEGEVSAESPSESDVDSPAVEDEPASDADGSDEPEVLGDTASSSEDALADAEIGIGTTDTGEMASSTDAEGGTGFETASSTFSTEVGTSTASSTSMIDHGSASASQSVEPSVVEVPSEEVSESEVVPSPLASDAEREALRARLMEEVKAEFLRGCVTLEKGGYYCLSDDARALPSNGLGDTTLSVSADTDGKGSDKEIFVTGRDTTLQLTENTVEDAFPSKDLTGQSIVWQSEVYGRWQIMVADLSSTTPMIAPLTAGLESNFNPAVEGTTVVWQGWVDGNWEIFVAERTDTVGEDQGVDARHVGAGPGWTVLRITHNQTHDMFPGIAGGMITWQAFDGSAWNVYAYSKATQETVRISAGEGSAERPRFAMLWEERDAEGRVRLMGYDVARGERVDVTEEARTAGDTRRAPGMPSSPVSSPDQPALPLSTSASSTSARSEGDAPPDPLLP